jgi:hypothetical protein
VYWYYNRPKPGEQVHHNEAKLDYIPRPNRIAKRCSTYQCLVTFGVTNSLSTNVDHHALKEIKLLAIYCALFN